MFQLTVRIDMGTFCDPMVRKMYVDEKRLIAHAIAAKESILPGGGKL